MLFIVTLVWALAEQPEALVIVTVYNPAAAVVTLVMDGFCNAEVNPLGPDHDQDDPALELRLKVPPAVTGLLLVAVTAGVGFTVTVKLQVEILP